MTKIKPNQPITEAKLTEFEKELAIELPADYRKFLLEFNGGKPDNICFDAGKLGKGSVDQFFGIDVSKLYDFKYNLNMYKDRVPGSFLPIAEVTSGDLVLLGINGKYRDKVYFWWHEDESDGKPWLKNISKISNTFTRFLNDLKPEAQDEYKGTLLDLFSSNDYPAQLQQINSGWDVNSKLESGSTAIRRVAKKGSIDVLKALIARGANLEGTLYETLNFNNIEGAKMLLEAGADPDEKVDSGGSSVLSKAIISQKIDIACLLIEFGADVTKGDSVGTPPLEIAELKLSQGNAGLQRVIDLIKSKL